MHISFFRFFCVLSMLVWGGGNNVSARIGRALIVAIGKYPVDSGWEKIHGDNDGVLMVELLRKQHYNQIILLKNEKATKENIIRPCCSCVMMRFQGIICFCIFLVMGSR